MDASWVDRIFTRLLARYGSKWVRMWDGVDMAIVNADWVEVLQGVNAGGIRYALDHLPPDHAPNAVQFRNLCLSKPEPELPRLEAPKADKARVMRELAKLNQVRQSILARKAEGATDE